MNANLVARLEAEAPALSAAVIAAMYEHPFWLERFGERGRKFAQEDGQRHVSYLVEALIAEDPGVLGRYACWLRSVLTARGMCSRHLEENFERLAHAIGATLDGSTLATAYLREACAALRYPAGPARELGDATARLADAATAELARVHPGTPSVWGEGPALTPRDDFVHYLSYLADAAEAAKSDGFVSYVAFVHESAVDHGRRAERVVLGLGMLSHAITADALLPSLAKDFAAQAFVAAAERIAERGATVPSEPRSAP